MSDHQPAPDVGPKEKYLIVAPQWSKALSLGSVCVLGLVLVGFLKGVTEHHAPVRASANVTSRKQESTSGLYKVVVDARSYRELPKASLSPNADWVSDFARLKTPKPGLFDPVLRTDAMKMAALVDRSRLRAFDGSPPVVPHTIEQQTAESCLVCHREGLQFGDKVATRMCHATFTSCTQCHVEAGSSGPLIDEPLAGNLFVGRGRSGTGERAMAGAPPTIPHTTFLREDCLSCHGLIARPGIRCTHPWLSNCQQCHAVDNELGLGVASFPAGSLVEASK